MKLCLPAFMKKFHIKTRLLLSFSVVILAVLIIGLTGFISLVNFENAQVNAYTILVLTVITIFISILLCFEVIKSINVPLSEHEKADINENNEELDAEAEKPELNPVEYYVSDIISDTVQFNTSQIGSKPVKLKIDVKENLPSKLLGDEQLIKQVLNSLLSNAVKYTEEGEVSLAVRYIIADENIMLKFIVKDTGCGIKNEDMKIVFSKKSSGASENDLFTAKKIVETMDGTITFESVYGKGSTFTATIWQTVNEYTPIGRETAERLNNFSSQ